MEASRIVIPTEGLEPYSPRAAYLMIVDAIETNGGDVRKAVGQVQKRMASSRAELARWWDGIGWYLLRELERDGMRQGWALRGEAKSRSTPMLGTPRPATPIRSWRDGIDPLAIVAPVGATGVRKPIGEWTREDFDMTVAFYRRSAATLNERADQMGRIRDKLREGETVRDARSRLDARDMEFLTRKLSAGDEPELLAAA